MWCSFILQDLQNVDRSLTPWVIVNGHRPIYTPSLSSVGPGSDLVVARDLQDALEALFFTYQVPPASDLLAVTAGATGQLSLPMDDDLLLSPVWPSEALLPQPRALIVSPQRF